MYEARKMAHNRTVCASPPADGSAFVTAGPFRCAAGKNQTRNTILGALKTGEVRKWPPMRKRIRLVNAMQITPDCRKTKAPGGVWSPPARKRPAQKIPG
jgi:hypothetical protein